MLYTLAQPLLGKGIGRCDDVTRFHVRKHCFPGHYCCKWHPIMVVLVFTGTADENTNGVADAEKTFTNEILYQFY